MLALYLDWLLDLVVGFFALDIVVFLLGACAVLSVFRLIRKIVGW